MSGLDGLEAVLAEYVAGNISAAEAMTNMQALGFQIAFIERWIEIQFEARKLTQSQINALRIQVRRVRSEVAASRTVDAGSRPSRPSGNIVVDPDLAGLYIITEIIPNDSIPLVTPFGTYLLGDIVTFSVLQQLNGYTDPNTGVVYTVFGVKL